MSVNKAPAFQFYPKEYLSDYKVLRMSWEAQGIYWSLISHIWNDTKTQYSIKNDPESIRAIFKLSKKRFEKVFKQIQWPDDPVFKEEDGMLISERLKEEKEKQLETSIKRQEAANKRWGTKENKSNALALQKECPAFASPTASSIALKEVKDICTFWNKQNIIIHRTFEKYLPNIKTKLKLYSWEEIIDAITNYKLVLDSPEHWLTKKWTLGQFLTRDTAFENFLSMNTPWANYKKQQPKPKPIQDGAHRPEPREEPKLITPKSQEAKGAWEVALEQIKDQIEPESFEVWFEPTIGYDQEGETLLVLVPNEMFANWIQDHYAEIISKALPGREVEFVAVPEIQ